MDKRVPFGTFEPMFARPSDSGCGSRISFCLAALALSSFLSAVGAESAAPGVAPPIRVYSRLLDPREHPDDDRRAVRPPSWDLFEKQTQFTSLRGFDVQGTQIVNYTNELERYTRTFGLGNVVWPSYPILFASNLLDLAQEVKRRNLYLFDVWGFVPGSGPGGYWQQFKPPQSAFDTLESVLGERWLGADIGEQDGRYIGGYASQMSAISSNRFDQYLNFQRHFERMGDQLGNKLSTLVSLNFGHYLLKEGTYTLIGAETAQALPNSQVYYAFIRGAGKQYGVPWFGNASIFNRWGFKTYGSEGVSDGYPDGPTRGTSLSLLKRLLYSHIAYNSVLVGFESGWFDGDKLSPIGRIQQAAQKWVKENGSLGVMHTPVAVLLDFYSGWSFPRHLYTDKLYRVWGNLPYARGDHLTHGVLDLLYPGYVNASYFHDESGFIAPTPYADVADCLLSDAPSWLLDRYPVLVVAGELHGGAELGEKLTAYVERGGHLLITAGNLAKWPSGLGGVRVKPDRVAHQCKQVELQYPKAVLQETPFDLLALDCPSVARCLATAGDAHEPAVIELSIGEGTLTVFASAFGVPVEPRLDPPVRGQIDQPLPTPYPLLRHVRQFLQRAFAQQALFVAEPELSLITCRRAEGDYTVSVANNTWHAQSFNLQSRCGAITSLQELPLDVSERTAVGLTPDGLHNADLGTSDANHIAGGDVRIFRVRVQETNVQEIAHRSPPRRPQGRFLPLHQARSLKEEILARPTFFQHFDGVLLDWRYVHEKDAQILQQEARWLTRQKVRVFVDLSSGLNLYPDLRLIDNDPDEYAATRAIIKELLDKMARLGARDLLLSLHRQPENNFTGEQTKTAFEKALRELSEAAAQRGITVYLRLAPDKPPASLAEAMQLLDRVGAPNLKLAPSVALWLRQKPTLPAGLAPRVGLWLLSGPASDLAGAPWSYQQPLATADCAPIRTMIAAAPQAPWALDAVFADQDAEYREITTLEKELGRVSPTSASPEP